MSKTHFAQPWKLRFHTDDPKLVLDETAALFEENGYKIHKWSNRGDLAFDGYTAEKHHASRPDGVRALIRRKDHNLAELLLAFGVSTDSFWSNLRGRIIYGGFTLALLSMALKAPSSFLHGFGELLIALVGLGALLYVILSTVHQRFQKRLHKTIKTLGQRLKEKELTFDKTLEALPPHDLRSFPTGVIIPALSIDMVWVTALMHIAGLPPALIGGIVLALLCAALQSFYGKGTEKLGLIGANFIFCALLIFLAHVPILAQFTEQGSYAQPHKARLHKIMAEEKRIRDGAYTTASEQATAERRLSEAGTPVRRAGFFNLVSVIFAIPLLMMLILMVPVVIGQRAFLYQTTRTTSKITRWVGLGEWLVLAIGVLHAIWFSTGMLINTLFDAEIISYPMIEIARTDVRYFTTQILSLAFSPSEAYGVAPWILVPFFSICPSIYLFGVTYAVVHRRTLYTRLRKSRIKNHLTEKVLDKVWDPDKERPIISVTDGTEIRAQSYWFPLRRQCFIELSALALKLPEEDILGILAHECHHLERDKVKLLLAAFLSTATLTGSGFLYASLDTHEIEFAADRRAIQEMGNNQAAAERFCSIIDMTYDSATGESAAWFNPAGAFVPSGPNEKKSPRSTLGALFLTLFDTDVPYVHPTRSARKDAIREGVGLTKEADHAKELLVDSDKDLGVSPATFAWKGLSFTIRATPTGRTFWLTVSIDVFSDKETVLASGGDFVLSRTYKSSFEYEGEFHEIELTNRPCTKDGFPCTLRIDGEEIGQAVVGVEQRYLIFLSGWIIMLILGGATLGALLLTGVLSTEEILKFLNRFLP